MRFGISTFVTDDGIRPDVLARALEERGFDALFLAEHSHLPVGDTDGPDGSPLPAKYYRTLDPFLALTAAATATSSLLLGTGIVLLTQRDLIHTAKEVATLDLLSGGRVLFGVGAGWHRQEMANHGTDPRTRGALLDEQLAALKRIWSTDGAEFHGRHVDFDPIHQWPKPVRQPPIYIGGQSESALERLYTHGDGWLPVSVTPQQVREVRAELTARGRSEVVINAPAGTNLAELTEAGIDRATFFLETMPESETLRELDRIAEGQLR
ncbi:TIGR03619 family F420-dependent LLM class oxidoreductase [Sciscionella sediminilitoris]|uniref:TIGR03619 family F420-dependent LLM class oxidoreductase n=1 Tax=Sciscionella sediminilitoris TaxID=1445613 RepID=UPI0004DF7C4B|nr:TIGR03619 family F420-dependent LLM class oxidoreductase [Sciscionella sp. SE31]